MTRAAAVGALSYWVMFIVVAAAVDWLIQSWYGQELQVASRMRDLASDATAQLETYERYGQQALREKLAASERRTGLSEDLLDDRDRSIIDRRVSADERAAAKTAARLLETKTSGAYLNLRHGMFAQRVAAPSGRMYTFVALAPTGWWLTVRHTLVSSSLSRLIMTALLAALGCGVLAGWPTGNVHRNQRRL